ncbi:MAG: 6-bladed beta-propeller, partial [Dehalococcoidia bacterium]
PWNMECLVVRCGMEDPLMVGLGDNLYEVWRPWISPRAASEVGWMSDVATDNSDQLYTFNRFDRYTDPPGQPVISVYDATGGLLETMTLPDLSDGHGISIGPNDELILVDRDRHVVHILNRDGNTLLVLGEPNRPGRPFSHPTAAKFGPGGDIFVADGYGNSKIHRFSARGALIKSWGSPGNGPGEFSTPHDISFTQTGEVVVCDRENNRIQIFDVEGGLIRQVPDVFHPMAVSVDENNMILVSDQIPRLSMFNSDGQLVGRCRPTLYGGHGMCLDKAGNIYLTELRVNRVTRLRRVTRDGGSSVRER